MPLPEAVADDGHGSGTPASVKIVIGGEDAAAHGGHPEDTEVIAADPQAFGEMALASRGQIEAVGGKGQGSGESLLAIPHLLPDRVGDNLAIGTAFGGSYLHEPVRIFHRQRTEHERVEDAEYGGVCADAQ